MVSIGGVNVAQALVEAEMRILVLERIVETLINSPFLIGQRSTMDLDAIRKQAVTDLQKKYPGLGIKAPER
jgi:two-component sensor histidine kinase